MKKMMFSVLCVVCALTATAQEVTKRVKVPGFSGISAESVFDITLVRANKCAVEIFCPKEIEEALDVKVSGGDLVLRLNTDRLDRKERRNFRGGVRAVVSIPALERLQLSGAARLSTTSVFEGSDFVMGLSGASSATGLNFPGAFARADQRRRRLRYQGDVRRRFSRTFGRLPRQFEFDSRQPEDRRQRRGQYRYGRKMRADRNRNVGRRAHYGFRRTGALKASGSGGAQFGGGRTEGKRRYAGCSGAAGLRVWAVQNLSVSACPARRPCGIKAIRGSARSRSTGGLSEN